MEIRANRTDGMIERDDLGLIPRFAPGAPEAFVAAGLWAAVDTGWLILDYQTTQTSRSELETLEKMLSRDRVKKARKRAEKAAGTSDVPGDVPPDGPPVLHRQGQDRQGQDRKVVREGDQKQAEEPPTTDRDERNNGAVFEPYPEASVLCSNAGCDRVCADIEPWPELCELCAQADAEL